MTRLKINALGHGSVPVTLSKWRQILQAYNFATDKSLEIQPWVPISAQVNTSVVTVYSAGYYLKPNGVCKWWLDMLCTMAANDYSFVVVPPLDVSRTFRMRAGSAYFYDIAGGAGAPGISGVSLVCGDVSMLTALTQPTSFFLALQNYNATKFTAGVSYEVVASGEYEVADNVSLN